MYSDCLPCLYDSKRPSLCFRSQCPLNKQHRLHEPNNIAYNNQTDNDDDDVDTEFCLNRLIWQVAKHLLHVM
jgi:hypothetical protein